MRALPQRLPRRLSRALMYRLAGTSVLRRLGAGKTMGAMNELDGMGTRRARCVLAPNPSPMTLDGTNTWIVAEPGSTQAIVVDPGPKDMGHLRRVLQAVQSQDRQVVQILLTHGHPDHSGGAKKFAEMAGAGRGVKVNVRALDPRHRLGDEGLAEGDAVRADGLELVVMETPGHTDDSLCFWLPADHVLLTGDTVLGRGTTVVEGKLGDYLDSLDRLRDFAADSAAQALLPGHGDMLDEPVAALDHYIRHRRDRLAQVEAALNDGAQTAREVVERVYADVDRSLWPAAEWSVQAQLDFLRKRGSR